MVRRWRETWADGVRERLARRDVAVGLDNLVQRLGGAARVGSFGASLGRDWGSMNC